MSAYAWKRLAATPSIPVAFLVSQLYWHILGSCIGDWRELQEVHHMWSTFKDALVGRDQNRPIPKRLSGFVSSCEVHRFVFGLCVSAHGGGEIEILPAELKLKDLMRSCQQLVKGTFGTLGRPWRSFGGQLALGEERKHLRGDRLSVKKYKLHSADILQQLRFQLTSRFAALHVPGRGRAWRPPLTPVSEILPSCSLMSLVTFSPCRTCA